MVDVAKEISEYLLNCGITIAAGYLPPKQVECSSRIGISKQFGLLSVDAKSWWFSESSPNKGFPEIDLFAFCLSHQIPTCIAWKPDLHSHLTDAFQQNWAHKFLYGFPPFCMIPNVPNKTLKEILPKLILITLTWITQTWYPKMLSISIKSHILLH